MFDIVISSGCISAILDQDKIEKTILNCARMISVNGYILLIEPIHRFHFLSRNNINESKIKNMLEKNGMQLKLRKAFLHWPTKLLISNTKINALLTKLIFYAGEFFCKLPFSYMLGDYKVMLYKKQTNHDQM